ncbi:unnamed protein product [Closterium sp. Naga37s-1]|nr:unnamed protein product [Closterium sp. Naga37s-1]
MNRGDGRGRFLPSNRQPRQGASSGVLLRASHHHTPSHYTLPPYSTPLSPHLSPSQQQPSQGASTRALLRASHHRAPSFLPSFPFASAHPPNPRTSLFLTATTPRSIYSRPSSCISSHHQIPCGALLSAPLSPPPPPTSPRSNHAKEHLLASFFVHLKRTRLAKFVACFPNLSNWILLSGPHGSEVYQDTLVRAIARKLNARLIAVDADKFLSPADMSSVPKRRPAADKPRDSLDSAGLSDSLDSPLVSSSPLGAPLSAPPLPPSLATSRPLPLPSLPCFSLPRPSLHPSLVPPWTLPVPAFPALARPSTPAPPHPFFRSIPLVLLFLVLVSLASRPFFRRSTRSPHSHAVYQSRPFPPPALPSPLTPFHHPSRPSITPTALPPFHHPSHPPPQYASLAKHLVAMAGWLWGVQLLKFLKGLSPPLSTTFLHTPPLSPVTLALPPAVCELGKASGGHGSNDGCRSGSGEHTMHTLYLSHLFPSSPPVPPCSPRLSPLQYASLAKHLVAMAAMMAVGVAVGNTLGTGSGRGTGGTGAGGDSNSGAYSQSGEGEGEGRGGGDDYGFGSGGGEEDGATRALRVGTCLGGERWKGSQSGGGALLSAPQGSNGAGGGNIRDGGRPPRGATGQVVATYETVGVRFDSPVPGGHSLSGLCDGGHGHICYASELLLEESSSSVKECAATVALMQVLEKELPRGPIIVFIRDASRLAEASSSAAQFESQMSRLVGPIVFVGSVARSESSSAAAAKDADAAEGAAGGAAAAVGPASTAWEPLSDMFPNRFVVRQPRAGPAAEVWAKLMERDAQLMQMLANRRMLEKVMATNDLTCSDLDEVTFAEPLSEEEAEQVVGLAAAHAIMQGAAEGGKGGAEEAGTGENERKAKAKEGEAEKGKDEERKQGEGEREGKERGMEEGEEEKEVDEGESDGGELGISAKSIMHGIALHRGLQEEAAEVKAPPAAAKKITSANKFEERLLAEVVPPDEVGVTFSQIGALEAVKDTLKELVMLPLRRPELFTRGQLTRPCKGILLFGPPGTGKTMLAKAVATEAGASFINISMSAVLHKWLGEAEKSVKAIFSVASKMAPAVVFVDEVDSLLGRRGQWGEHEAMRKVKNEFMACWDGLRTRAHERVLVLAATNRPFDLDDAIIRRFPRRLMVDLPDADNREKIVRVILKDEEVEEGFDYKELAAMTEGYSGSDLKNLCVTAAYQPIKEILKQEEVEKKRLQLEEASKKADRSTAAAAGAVPPPPPAAAAGSTPADAAAATAADKESGEVSVRGVQQREQQGVQTGVSGRAQVEGGSVVSGNGLTPGQGAENGDGVGGTEVGGSEVGGSEVGGSEVGGSEVGGSEVGGSEVGGKQVLFIEGDEAGEKSCLEVACNGDASNEKVCGCEDKQETGMDGNGRRGGRGGEEGVSVKGCENGGVAVKVGEERVVAVKEGEGGLCVGEVIIMNGTVPSSALVDGALASDCSMNGISESVTAGGVSEEDVICRKDARSAEAGSDRDRGNERAAGDDSAATAEGSLVAGDKAIAGESEREGVAEGKEAATATAESQGKVAGSLSSLRDNEDGGGEKGRSEKVEGREGEAEEAAKEAAKEAAEEAADEAAEEALVRGIVEDILRRGADDSTNPSPADLCADMAAALEMVKEITCEDDTSATDAGEKGGSSITEAREGVGKSEGEAERRDGEGGPGGTENDTQSQDQQQSQAPDSATSLPRPRSVSLLQLAEDSWRERTGVGLSGLGKAGVGGAAGSGGSGGGGGGNRVLRLRPITMADMRAAKQQVAPSTAGDSSSMAELRQWNDLYGEGGSRKKEKLTYFL